MPFDPELKIERHYIEAWGAWWLDIQQKKKERLRRHMMSTQTRLKQFEEKHLIGSKSDGGSLAVGASLANHTK